MNNSLKIYALNYYKFLFLSITINGLKNLFVGMGFFYYHYALNIFFFLFFFIFFYFFFYWEAFGW